MLFRPEEIHTASSESRRDLSRQKLGERDIHVGYGRRRIHFQDFVVPHADEDQFPAIEATRVDTDLSAGKKPAHGERFQPS